MNLKEELILMRHLMNKEHDKKAKRLEWASTEMRRRRIEREKKNNIIYRIINLFKGNKDE
jgi:hypothetical protein